MCELTLNDSSRHSVHSTGTSVLGDHQATGLPDVTCTVQTITTHAREHDQSGLFPEDGCRGPGERIDRRHTAVYRLPDAQGRLQTSVRPPT
jgi:hypothetical protein